MSGEPDQKVEVAKGETLPFDTGKKQDALLGHLVQNEPFFLQAKDKIRGEWFSDPWNQKIWDVKLAFFKRVGRPPISVFEFQDCEEFMARFELPERNRLRSKMIENEVAAHEYGLDGLRQELTSWFRSRVFKAWIEHAGEQYNAAMDAPDPRAKMESAYQSVSGCVSALQQATFESDESVDFSTIADGSIFRQREADLDGALTFGCAVLDQKLNRDCRVKSSITKTQAEDGTLIEKQATTAFSLLKGDHTVLLAPTNIGKTTTMMTVGICNILQKRSVLIVTHEGRSEDISMKALQCLLGMSYQDLYALLSTEQGRQVLGKAASFLTKYLTYVPMNRANLSVEDVEATIRRSQEKRVIETGRGYDLIIDDYPAKLTTVEASRGHWAKRQIDEKVYNIFTQLGLEFKAHILTAIQTNREGSKINAGRKGAEDRLIGMEDVMESWGAMTTATNVITLNRGERAKASDLMTFHVVKSRSNEVGWSVVAKTRFDVARTHGFGMAATCYRGEGTVDITSDLLQQYDGVSLPLTYYS
jgi:hypothetical protein